MKYLAAAAATVLLVSAPGCGGRGSAALYEGSIQDFDDPGLKPLKDEIRALPFRHIEWEYKFTEKEIKRITLGVEYLYIETPDKRVMAVDRFSGVTRWIYQVDTDTELTWPPVEAYGVPDEIRRHEADLRAAQRRIEDLIKETGDPGRKEVVDAQARRNQIRELLRGAQSGDNVYFISVGVLYCLVRTTGNLLWTRRLTNEFAPGAQPFAIRTHIFVPGADLTRVWALDVSKKGESVNFYRTSIGQHDRQITNRPLYEDPALYFVSHDGAIYSYGLQGTVPQWRFQTEDHLNADPVLYRYRHVYRDPDGRDRALDIKFLFIGGYDHAFYALDATNGQLLWKYETAGQIKTPAVGRGETVYVKTEGGALFAFDVTPFHRDATGAFAVPRAAGEWPWKRNGRLRWKLPLGERFVVRGRDHVYVLGPNHEIYRLNEFTGELIGRYPLKLLGHVVTNPIDDILYVAHGSGYIFALRETRE